MGDSQSQKAAEGSTLIQAGGNVQITLGLSCADVKLIIAEERERILQEVWERAQEMLREAGIRPGPVPLKTLVPITQYASLDNDAYLQERWAGLLANASTSGTQGGAYPSFVEILRQLSPQEAKLLNSVYDSTTAPKGAYIREHTEIPTSVPDLHGLLFRDLHCMYGGVGDNLSLNNSLDNLLRLGLLVFKEGELFSMQQLYGEYEIGPTKLYGITTLGVNFVGACRPPQKPGPQ